MRISDPKTFNSKLVNELQLDALSGILTQGYQAYVNASLQGSTGAAAPVSYGYAYLNADGKVDPTILPPLAINETYTEEATNADSALTTLDLVKRALTDNSVENVERGDIVVVYGATDISVENAEKLCGTFIFTQEVAAADVVEDSYVKIYTPAGGVQTVNGVTPVDGNVAIDASNIPYLSGNVESTLDEYNTRLAGIDGDLTVIKDDSSTSGSMQYYAKQAEDNAKTYTDEQIAALAAVKKFVKVDSLDPKPESPTNDTLYLTENGQCAIYAASGWVDISIEVITEITEDTANDDKIASIAAIKAFVNEGFNGKIDKITGTAGTLVTVGTTEGTLSASVYSVSSDTSLSGTNIVPTADAVKAYVDENASSTAEDLDEVKTQAIKLVSVTHQWQSSEKAGQIYTWITSGQVIQICDASGWVFPGVQFSGVGDAISSTITVQMETAEGSIDGETWTYFIAQTLA